MHTRLNMPFARGVRDCVPHNRARSAEQPARSTPPQQFNDISHSVLTVLNYALGGAWSRVLKTTCGHSMRETAA